MLLAIKKNLFTESLAKNWTKLPRDIMKSPSLGVFKRHIDVAMRDVV